MPVGLVASGSGSSRRIVPRSLTSYSSRSAIVGRSREAGDDAGIVFADVAVPATPAGRLVHALAAVVLDHHVIGPAGRTSRVGPGPVASDEDHGVLSSSSGPSQVHKPSRPMAGTGSASGAMS